MGFSSVILLLLLGILNVGGAEIYIVTVEGEPVISYQGGIDGFEATAVESDEKIDTTSELVTSYAQHLVKKHDMLLALLFDRGTYKKIYSYHHLINGFAAHISHEQAEILRRAPGVKSVERDWKVRRLTTHTPQFLGLPTGVWPTGGGFDRAGEDIVIGFIDSGIYPHHPSFASHSTEPYGPLPKYRGKCEIDPNTKKDYCNGKIIGAQHFAGAAKAAGSFNPEIDFDSPLDGDGHGSHTAAIAAGNNGIPVRMHGFEFGRASGMAPRARIAVYKALYRLFGGFVADVVAAIEQVSCPNLKQLRIMRANISALCSHQLPTAYFSKLEVLHVTYCSKLRNLMSPSVARGLLNLKNLEIESCVSMEEVITEEGEEIMTNEPIFPLLEMLKLSDLPMLGHFIHTTRTLEFPLLLQMTTICCPEMKTFVLQGSVSTPNLQEVKSGSTGDLNKWIQQKWFNSKEQKASDGNKAEPSHCII